MTRAGRLLCACALLFATPIWAAAQFGPQRSAWGPMLDTIGASAATRVLWRGYDLGAGAHGAINIGVWGRSVTAAGPWSVSMMVDGIAVAARTAPVSASRASGGLEIARALGAAGAELRGRICGYWLDQRSDGDIGAEAHVALEGLPIPWLPEVWPTLHARVTRATQPLAATFISAALRQEFGIRQFALRLETGVDWDDLGRDDLGAGRWRAEAGVSIGMGDSWMARVEGGAVQPRDATLGWAGIGLSWRY